MESFEIGGKTCELWLNAGSTQSRPVIILFAGEKLSDIAAALADEPSLPPCGLVSFRPCDWHAEFSPWPALAISDSGEAFSGGAGRTLDWVTGSLIPALSAHIDCLGEVMGAGYSLGGLAVLWASLEMGVFRSLACCSGSLWFEGFAEYQKTRQPLPGSRIYLSLGKTEEKTVNRAMSTVGDITRSIYERFESDTNVAQTELVWHDGGHFRDIPHRLAAAVRWLIG